MSHVLTRIADGLVARFAPALQVQAANCRRVERFCFCKGPDRYTETCAVCDGGTVVCKPCIKTGSCVGPLSGRAA